MLSRQELLASFPAGERTADRRLVGVEYEKLLQDYKTGLSIPWTGKYGIESVMKFLVDSFGWEPYEEEDITIALKRGKQRITLEPGGQFEMSGAPLRTLGEIRAELDNHLEEMGAVEETFPIRSRWYGLNPSECIEQIKWMPKPRYRTMRRYMPTKGSLGLAMMGLTCTVQANLDILSEVDFARKLRMGTGIGPLITALFANSPFYCGEPSGYQSFRAHVWHDTDPDRCGTRRFVFETDAGYEDYVNWALSVPIYFVKRAGRYIDLAGKGTFKELNEGRVDGHHAEPEDWQLHLSTLFPDVRARPHLEFRQADVVPPEMIMALPALCKGLMYDEVAADAAWDLVKGFTFDERQTLSRDAAKDAIRASRPGRLGTIAALCGELIAIAAHGLDRQATAGQGADDDGKYLDPLREIVASGRTLADKTLERWGEARRRS